MALTKRIILPLILVLCTAFLSNGCLRYSFTGTSIPEGVETIFIPFFPDQSDSGIGDLSDRLNQALIERFVNQSSLQLANTEEDADVVLNGRITGYSNRPFSIGGDQQTDQNEVRITVNATYQFAGSEDPEWSKSFSAQDTYNPAEDPISGERNSANEVMETIANNMFNDAVSNW